MKYYFRLGFVLLIITVVASGILAYINSITKPIIDENNRIAKQEARLHVLPEAVSFDSIFVYNDENVYQGKNDAGDVVGYTFVASQYGYSSDVKTMVGVLPDFKINRISIIEQQETPGLGANCEKPKFLLRFDDLSEQGLLVDKDGGKLESITGATITTRTIAYSIKDGLEELQKKIIQTNTKLIEEPEVTK